MSNEKEINKLIKEEHMSDEKDTSEVSPFDKFWTCVNKNCQDEDDNIVKNASKFHYLAISFNGVQCDFDEAYNAHIKDIKIASKFEDKFKDALNTVFQLALYNELPEEIFNEFLDALIDIKVSSWGIKSVANYIDIAKHYIDSLADKRKDVGVRLSNILHGMRFE